MTGLFVNGKFLTSPSTGVHRVASELTKALDRVAMEMDEGSPLDCSLLVPAGERQNIVLGRFETLILPALSNVLKNILWEQFTLPRHARDGILLNLCNLGPVLKGRSITMFHDAQVYISPESYSVYFRIWYRLVQPILGRRASKILTVSNYSKAQLAKYGVAPLHRIEVVHNGCDHVLSIKPDEDFVCECGLEKGRYILALANTQAHKNISVLLKAFFSHELRDQTLVLFGSARKADFEAQGHSVPDNVKFIGRISDEQLVCLMKHALAYACPSLTEGFGLPPLEAMALGCPVVVAPCGALPEVCGDAAIYADPFKPEEWTRAINSLLSSTECGEERSSLGLAQASLFTWNRAALKLLYIIESCR